MYLAQQLMNTLKYVVALDSNSLFYQYFLLYLLLFGLRKIDGVGIDDFKNKFGKNPIFLFRKEIQKLVEQGLLEVDLNQIRLTRKGLDLANIVWEEFV